jgi:predicted tellurium resistance membrane protein TerC
MVVAMFLAVGAMIAMAGAIGGFIHKHPSLKILALSFLNLIGVMLLLEGMGQHENKGYIYSAMGFSFFVELLNMRYKRKHEHVHLRGPAAQ